MHLPFQDLNTRGNPGLQFAHKGRISLRVVEALAFGRVTVVTSTRNEKYGVSLGMTKASGDFLSHLSHLRRVQAHICDLRAMSNQCPAPVTVRHRVRLAEHEYFNSSRTKNLR